MNLEDELRAALRREDPSPDFARRVVARARATPRSTRPAFTMAWAAAIAAMVIVGLLGMYEYRQVQAERASRDAVVALRIVAEKLNMTRDKIVRRENN
jgi:hypothetical protein